MDKSKQVIERARTQVAVSCYVWGAKGQDICTKADPPSWVYSMEQGDSGYTKHGNTDRVIARMQYLKSQGLKSILCFDCSGFVYWCFKELSLITVRRNAQGYFNRCITKEKSRLRAGDLVFRYTGGKIAHIGLYAGDGKVIHCKGRDLGVVEEPIGKYDWNRFGRWPGVYDENESAHGGESGADEAHPTMVKAMGTVRIRSKPSTKGEKLGTSRDGETYLYKGTAATGWYEIEYKGGQAFISNKYTELI